jgi:Protein of unknown function (DUF4007)
MSKPLKQSKSKRGEKGHFSGHETFPLRQLWLYKAFRAAEENDFSGSVFSDDSAIAEFGVGRNMVSSIKHWALATGTLEESDGNLSAGPLGSFLIGSDDAPGVDPFFEDASSVWLVHWKLASFGRRSTTWRWLFNHVRDAVIDREHLLPQQLSWCESQGWNSNRNTLKRDLETCIRGYLPRSSATTPEEAAEPLLSELGILKSDLAGGIRFNYGPKVTLSDYVFYSTVLDFWRLKHIGAERIPTTIPIDAIRGPYGPGSVFKMTEDEVRERLDRAESLTEGRFALTDSSGITQVSVSNAVFSQAGELRQWTELACLDFARGAYRV